MRKLHPGEKVATSFRKLHAKSMHWLGAGYAMGEKEFFARWGRELEELRQKERRIRKVYNARNREKISAYRSVYNKAWRKKHPELARIKSKQDYNRNAAARREYARMQRAKLKNDPARLAEHKRKTNAARRRRALMDPQYRIGRQLRTRIWMAVHKGYGEKAAKTFDLLGCSLKHFISYIEGLMESGMTWENYGRDGWEIDHVLPCAAFDLTKPSEQRKCFHYTNTQPMWAKDNRSKGAKRLRQTELPLFCNP